MTEIIFECYSAPSLAYGIDSLFSYDYNNGKTGLVVSSSHSSTHLIPVLNSKALLTQATRLNWGGSQSAEYLLKLIRLKYPTFPGKLNSSQTRLDSLHLRGPPSFQSAQWSRYGYSHFAYNLGHSMTQTGQKRSWRKGFQILSGPEAGICWLAQHFVHLLRCGAMGSKCRGRLRLMPA